MQSKIRYDFSGTLWQTQTTGGWFFVSLPKDISKEIRDHLQWQEEGWGRMKAIVAIKALEWQTSIWFDKKSNTYLLPVKAVIRKKINLTLNETVDIRIWV